MQKPLIVAHRGASQAAPENTVWSCRRGIEAGADWVEIDVWQTADGHLVVIHDSTTARTGDRSLQVPASTLQALREVDVACAFRQKNPQIDVPPQRIPLLEEILDLIQAQKRCRLSIQPKSDCVGPIVALLKERNAVAMAGINEMARTVMEEARQLSGELALFWDRPADCLVSRDLPIATALGVEALVLEKGGMTAEKIRQIQDGGLQAGAWTVNDPRTMSQFAAWGIDRIYTDCPLEFLELRNASL